MAMSSVALDSECKLVYNEVQSKKKHRYVTFKIIEDKTIKVDKIGTRESTYDQFLTNLYAKDGQDDDCRYAIYDFEFDFTKNAKLIMISWCPDTARIEKKMIYSASFETLKKTFPKVYKCVEFKNSMDLMVLNKLHPRPM